LIYLNGFFQTRGIPHQSPASKNGSGGGGELIHCACDKPEVVMAGQPGFFDADERLKAVSAAGDPLERLAKVVDFELFRAELEAALARSDRSKGGQPPYDAVVMFKVLVLQTLYTLSDDATEYQLKDRLSFMRFCGLALHDPVPDETIWLFLEQLTRAGAHQFKGLYAARSDIMHGRSWNVRSRGTLSTLNKFENAARTLWNVVLSSPQLVQALEGNDAQRAAHFRAVEAGYTGPTN
jgi:hypothetical protein